jgi:hypothetical protein
MIGDLLGGLLRIVGDVLSDVVFEIGIRGTGYLICRLFNVPFNTDGNLVVIVGLVFWLLVGYAAFLGIAAVMR